jgi:D-glycero-alpha-D-manno-heptose 1-phosphate guanylyltransferase
MECIVLAGGLGTRLQGVIGEYPKCMAPVNGKPFLSYLFDYLHDEGCVRVILSLGYKHEVITRWVATQDLPFVVDFVIETEPLGTGGGIHLAMKEAVADNVVILNGDTMFMVDLKHQMRFHLSKHSCTTLALKMMYDFDRYGVVVTDDACTITSFEEKKHRDVGVINGGVYIVNTRHFLSKHFHHKFSFEKEYLEHYTSDHKFYGFASDAYFIDIGIPEDYELVQDDFKSMF